jgi:hypothetical protein
MCVKRVKRRARVLCCYVRERVKRRATVQVVLAKRKLREYDRGIVSPCLRVDWQETDDLLSVLTYCGIIDISNHQYKGSLQ